MQKINKHSNTSLSNFTTHCVILQTNTFFTIKKPDRLPVRLFLQITTILNIIKRGESFYHVSMVQNPARFPNGMHCPHGITDIHSTHFHLR